MKAIRRQIGFAPNTFFPAFLSLVDHPIMITFQDDKDQRGFVIYLLQGIYYGDIVRLERTFVG